MKYAAEIQVYRVVGPEDYQEGYCNILNNTKADLFFKRLKDHLGGEEGLWYRLEPITVIGFSSAQTDGSNKKLLGFDLQNEEPDLRVCGQRVG